jgi:threonine synthase
MSEAVRVVPEYLATGDYAPRTSVATISNAMDVGAPSNFARMQEIHGSEWERMKGRIAGYAFDDDQTRTAIREISQASSYAMDPHGAVGYLAAEEWKVENPDDTTVILETAHPSKFLDVMEEELGEGSVEIPERLACIAGREKVAVEMSATEDEFLAWLRRQG